MKTFQMSHAMELLNIWIYIKPPLRIDGSSKRGGDEKAGATASSWSQDGEARYGLGWVGFFFFFQMEMFVHLNIVFGIQTVLDRASRQLQA